MFHPNTWRSTWTRPTTRPSYRQLENSGYSVALVSTVDKYFNKLRFNIFIVREMFSWISIHMFYNNTWTFHHPAGVKLRCCPTAHCAAILGRRIVAGSGTRRRPSRTRYVTGGPLAPWRPVSVNYIHKKDRYFTYIQIGKNNIKLFSFCG